MHRDPARRAQSPGGKDCPEERARGRSESGASQARPGASQEQTESWAKRVQEDVTRTMRHVNKKLVMTYPNSLRVCEWIPEGWRPQPPMTTAGNFCHKRRRFNRSGRVAD